MDYLNLGYIIMYLQGVGSLFAWNAFITPVDYYKLRFTNASFETAFESMFTTSFTAFGLITIIALQWFQSYFSLQKRIVGSLSILCAVFAVITVLALTPLSIPDHELLSSLEDGATLQLIILLLCIAVSGTMQAILSGSIMSYASLLAVNGDTKYFQAVTGGQGVAGVIVTAGSMLSLAPSITRACDRSVAAAPPPPAPGGVEPDHAHELLLEASVYFGSACIVQFLCIVAFLFLDRLPYTRACRVASLEQQSRQTSRQGSLQEGSVAPLSTSAASTTSATSATSATPAVLGAAQPLPLPASSEQSAEEALLSEPATFAQVFWPLRFWFCSVCFIYTVSIGLFPALTASITSTADVKKEGCEWFKFFGPFLFLLFNLMDTLGRNMPCPAALATRPRVVLGLVLARLVFAPLFILCHSKSHPASLLAGSDAFPIIIMVVFAVTNGWLTTCVFVHSGASLPPELRARGSVVMVGGLNTGLMLGSLFSFAVTAISCQCNPFLSS